jgi:prohibitin 1
VKDVAKVLCVPIFLIGLFLFWMFCTTAVPSGHVGVVTTFGRVHDDALPSGIHVIAPWRWVTKLSVQTKEDKETAEVPTREGLSVSLEASLLYSLSHDKATDVFRTVGNDYEKVLVIPQFRSALRGATSHYDAKDLYTANREQIEESLTKSVKATLAERGIHCEAVLLRDVQLPRVVKDRIEAKLAADQDAQRMTFVLVKEKQEAERKRVEAQGIADAQKIIKTELDDNYIRYAWIQALKEHQGAIIYVPTGQDGLPFFKEVHKAGKEK